MDEKDILALQLRFDGRYKRLDECRIDMNELIAKYDPINTKLATIEAHISTISWLLKLVAGGVVTGVLGGLFALIMK